MLGMSVDVFDCKTATRSATTWLPVGYHSATGSHCLATSWRLVANQSPDAHLHMETGIFLQIQDLAEVCPGYLYNTHFISPSISRDDKRYSQLTNFLAAKIVRTQIANNMSKIGRLRLIRLFRRSEEPD